MSLGVQWLLPPTTETDTRSYNIYKELNQTGQIPIHSRYFYRIVLTVKVRKNREEIYETYRVSLER
jgi:hypothetical protein